MKAESNSKKKVAIPGKKELQVLEFDTPEKWERWLEKHHEVSEGIWIRFYKKGSGVATVVYAGALDVALCFGWIDGQAKSYDEKSYLQRFTPRRLKSIWSKRNIEHIERLDKEGRMRAAGWKAVDAAKADGRWEQAYDSPSNMKVPDDFLKLISKKKKTLTFFQSLNKTNQYAILWRLQTAKKAETRQKRMMDIIGMLERGEKFH
jgi:uncharacterized protein YdeI (YjbR/CyaY-like superfamily)